MIKAAILDADGTLLDSMGAWDVAAANYLAGRGVTARPDLQEVLFPLTLTECTVYLHEDYGIPESPEQIEAEIKAGMARFYREQVEAKPGAAEFLTRLKAHGVKLALATNTARAAITGGLERTGLLPFLDGIFTTEEVGLDKRNPAYFHHVRQALGTEPAETWVFEDAVHAAATAYNAGFPVAGVPDPYSDQEELKKVCHLYLPGLTDFDGFWSQAQEITPEQGEEKP